ncbi:hypothetical protein ScPMuIL_008570 [Solemya velum]
MKTLMLIYLLTLYFTITDAVLCYQCADSSGSEEFAPCQYEISDLSAAAYETLTTNRLSKKYSKNCSHSDDTPYCIIEEIQQGGKVTTFMRDCSDGKTFSFPLMEVPKLKHVQPDNQTTCSFQGQGQVLCVSGLPGYIHAVVQHNNVQLLTLRPIKPLMVAKQLLAAKQLKTYSDPLHMHRGFDLSPKQWSQKRQKRLHTHLKVYKRGLLEWPNLLQVDLGREFMGAVNQILAECGVFVRRGRVDVHRDQTIVNRKQIHNLERTVSGIEERVTLLESGLSKLRCPHGYIQNHRDCYKVVIERKNWTEALESCRTEGANLLRTEKAKNRILFQNC